MNKNPIKYLTLLLCLILLALTIVQTCRLEALRSEMASKMNDLENELYTAIGQISSDLRYELEEAAQPVEDYAVNLSAIDPETHSVCVDASVTLKQWSTDSTVQLIVAGEDDKTTMDMASDGTGTFTAQLSVPLENTQGFWLEAMVTTGGISTRMELEGYPDLLSLLPLRSGGCGWSGPEYDQGVLTMDYEQYLEWQYDQPVSISNAHFDVYVDDALAETIPAQAQGYTTLRLDALKLECDENATVRLVLRCEDSFGLGYTFQCLELTLEDGMVTESYSMESTEFYWVTEAKNCDH